jgi:hypothetical protein
MTNETPQTDVTALHVRINAITCELDALSAGASTNILRPDAGERNAEHERRTAVLRHELAGLRALLPAAGMASGQRLVIYQGLGEVILRDDPEPEYVEADTPVDLWDWSE